MSEPRVSIVVPCRDEARHIGPCLDSTLAAHGARLQRRGLGYLHGVLDHIVLGRRRRVAAAAVPSSR